MRFATDILVVEQPLRRDACLGKADDHAVDGGDALGLVVPLKGAMGDADVEAVPQHFASEHPDLPPLGDGVCGDEGTAGRLSHCLHALAGTPAAEVRDLQSTRLNSSHYFAPLMLSSACKQKQKT